MGRRKETKEIDGAKYEIRKMGSFAALRVQAQLAKLLGEPLARMIAEADSVASLLALDVDGEGSEMLASAVQVLSDRLDPDLVVDVARQLIVGNVSAEYNGQMVEIDSVDTYEHIAEQHDPWHQLRLLQACVVVQFRPHGAGARTAQVEQPAEVRA